MVRMKFLLRKIIQSKHYSISTYEDKQKTELTNILRKIDGVGEVDVMINFESGEEKVAAYDSTNQTTKTEETDTNGGIRLAISKMTQLRL